jgi:PRC-barrel domain
MADPISPSNYSGALRLVPATLKTGLNAYARDGKKIGVVEQLMIDMFSGQARYAVLSFGGFLGLGQKYHPVPFELLRLSTDGAGYVIDIDQTMIDGSPSYRLDDAPAFDEAYGSRIASYYGTNR